MSSEETHLPWQRAEKPTPHTDIQEYLEGKQICRLHYLDDVGPTGSRGMALELTTGERFIIWAGRVQDDRFTARLYFRWIRRPLIVLPRMEKIWRFGVSRDPTAEPPDQLQKALEGRVIHGVLHSKRPMKTGGEQLAIEMVGGGRFAIGAEPTLRATDDGEMMLADLRYLWSEPERPRTYSLG